MEKKVKSMKIKNLIALQKGSASFAIIAAVLIGIIAFNVLISALADRFHMEYDMTPQKINTISEKNLEFIKGLDQEVEITFCADKDNYIAGEMEYYAQQYGVYSDAADYYNQTITFVEKYADYNKKIKVEFIETQSSQFSALRQKYTGDSIGYGDIVVAAKNGANEKHKVLTYTDIYQLTEEQSELSYMYGSSYTVGGNNIETALTSAIAFVTSAKTKKLAVLSGHSSKDYVSDFARTTLSPNNYEVVDVADKIVGKLDSSFDAVMIAAPTSDFLGEELEIIAEFLDNDGKLDKGLFVFLDSESPYLPNLYDFLSQWGIDIGEGILYETDDGYHVPGDPFTMLSFPTESDDELTEDMSGFLTGYNVPLEVGFESNNDISTSVLSATSESVVAAPLGTQAGWQGYTDDDIMQYPTAIQSMKEAYTSENVLMSSYVTVFSSVEFIDSQFLSQYNVSNSALALAVAERAVHAVDSGITFETRTIETESFAADVTESSAKAMRIIFMIVIPLISIAAGVFVFIRRRNS